MGMDLGPPCVSPPKPISLPVIAEPARPVPRRSRFARWRAVSLIAVNLLMAAHVIHWAVTGRSLGRFVLSDSMRTLELGEINPGFILFALALIITAVLGRFMCGWVCHMGALQDLCSWMLRRVGVRPRLFRSRLLGFVPLGVAFYMFIWPTLEREAVRPMLSTLYGGTTGAEFPGISFDLTSHNLWEGLPSVWIAIPFLLLCGFGTVYFLGARGLCRYGCPYGGFLLPAERVAPWRVVVEPAKCDQCGLCTAACTAGVRVHDQVRLFGEIRDSNCIRSLDCIGVCPQNALAFTARRARPMDSSPRAERRARYDLTMAEEVALLAVFVAVFFITRDLYGRIPMLLSATLGVLAAFFTWKAWRLVRSANVRLGPMVMKQAGRMKAGGWSYAAFTIVMALLVAHSAAVRGMIWAASEADHGVTVSFAQAMSGDPVPERDRDAARRASTWYSRALPFWAGGFALAETADARVRLAWMQIVLGDRSAAMANLRTLADAGLASDANVVSLAQLESIEGGWDAYEAVLRRALDRHPSYSGTRDALAAGLFKMGRQAEAEAIYRDRLARRATDAPARAGLGQMLIASDRVDEGIDELRKAAAEQPRNTSIRATLAMDLAHFGRLEEALAELKSAGRANPPARAGLMSMGADLLAQAGRTDEAADWRRQAGLPATPSP